MNVEHSQVNDKAVREAAAQLLEAAAAKKCWACGCLHQSIPAIEKEFANKHEANILLDATRRAKERLMEVRYDCLGCEVCYPALATNALSHEAGELLVAMDCCPAANVQERNGWPPLPGAYRVLRYQSPVAVCTLTDEALCEVLAREAGLEIGIVGTLQTENLGIERVVTNILANPFLRFLIVCGADSRKAIGHLPGRSLVALAREGIDERMRIVGAPGKRPVLRNLSPEAVEHFRRTVEVVDRIGNSRPEEIHESARACAARSLEPVMPFSPGRVVKPAKGHLPQRLIPDPAGYFVVFIDRARRLLWLEHYSKDGVLDAVIEGPTAAEVYTPAIEKGLLTRLDHAAYLGKELARAELALKTGEPFRQDSAPGRQISETPANSGCHSNCQEAR